jgi:hypothetical protein
MDLAAAGVVLLPPIFLVQMERGRFDPALVKVIAGKYETTQVHQKKTERWSISSQ